MKIRRIHVKVSTTEMERMKESVRVPTTKFTHTEQAKNEHKRETIA